MSGQSPAIDAAASAITELEPPVDPHVDSQPPAAPPRVPRDAALLAVSIFLVIAATNILTPLLANIRDDFGISITTVGFVVGSYGMARLAVDLPAGFLSDTVGHRRLSVVAIGVLVVASVLGLMADRVEILIASRIGSGLAVGVLATVILTALSATATPTNRGKVMSLFHVANNVGIALYPMLGGLIGLLIGWRATFVVTGVLAVVAGLLLLPLLLRIDFPKRGEGASGTGSDPRVLYGRQRSMAIAVTNVGVVANMIHRHGFRNTILPLYAATVLGLGELSIATAIALMSITGLMVATPGGMLGDRIGRRRVITAGLAAVAVGDLLFLLTGDLVTFLLGAAIVGFGDFFTSSQTALLSEVVPADQRTRVLSGYRFSADLGALLGPVVLAAVMDMADARAAIVAAAAILLGASILARVGVPAPASGHAGASAIRPETGAEPGR